MSLSTNTAAPRRFQMRLSTLLVGSIAVSVLLAFHIIPREQKLTSPIDEVRTVITYGYPFNFYYYSFTTSSSSSMFNPLAIVGNLLCLFPVFYFAECLTRYQTRDPYERPLYRAHKRNVFFAAVLAVFLIYLNTGATWSGSSFGYENSMYLTIHSRRGWPQHQSFLISGVLKPTESKNLLFFSQKEPCGETPFTHDRWNSNEIEKLVWENVPMPMSWTTILRNGVAIILIVSAALLSLEYLFRRRRGM